MSMSRTQFGGAIRNNILLILRENRKVKLPCFPYFMKYLLCTAWETKAYALGLVPRNGAIYLENCYEILYVTHNVFI